MNVKLQVVAALQIENEVDIDQYFCNFISNYYR